MPCYHPIPARREHGISKAIPGLGGAEARTSVRLFPGLSQANLQIPCGRCIGCKTRRAQEWAARVVHETRYHDSNVFVTLTYSDDQLPPGGELVPRHLQLFLKRLRKAAAAGSAHIVGTRLRYVACGEYGDHTKRPHYHAILFGLAFSDEQIFGHKLKTSATLTALWGHGHAVYGEVTAASAAYVAGYTMKSMGLTHCDEDGVLKQSPFLRVSTRPGIGATYADRYLTDFRGGFLVVDGAVHPVPRYYKKRLQMADPNLAEEASENAIARQCERVARDPLGNLPDRLVAGEQIALRKQQLTRRHSL